METTFNFKSQVCTSRSQSEKLLALGLKKETADCVLPKKDNLPPLVMPYDKASIYTTIEIIPAWSLHRIMSMVYSSRAKKNGLRLAIIRYDNPFEDMIQQIEWLIKEGYFNKEYLENGN